MDISSWCVGAQAVAHEVAEALGYPPILFGCAEVPEADQEAFCVLVNEGIIDRAQIARTQETAEANARLDWRDFTPVGRAGWPEEAVIDNLISCP